MIFCLVSISYFLNLWTMILNDLLSGLRALFYPQCCCVCEKKLIEGENYICLDCLLKMPETNYCSQPENAASNRLSGKIPYEKVVSFLYYNKGGWAQNVIANIKYKENPDLGRYMGVIMANEMRLSSFFEGVDWLVPIPLHPKKQKKRGFNQTEKIAEGVSKITGIPVSVDLVVRKIDTRTQTKKGRYDRWLNTSGIFESQKNEKYANQHFLIIDDVLTTGATIEACVTAIMQSYEDAQISVLTLAFAE